MTDTEQRIAKLGELVRTHRRSAGLTQIDLADLAGVGKTTVHDIEKGKTTVQIDNLFAVLRVLNIEVLFSGPLQQPTVMDTASESTSTGAVV